MSEKKLIRGPAFSGYVCVYECVYCIGTGINMCVCVYAHMTYDVHLALCLLKGTGSLIGLELISSAGLASQEPQDSPSLHLPRAQITRKHPHARHFCILGGQTHLRRPPEKAL